MGRVNHALAQQTDDDLGDFRVDEQARMPRRERDVPEYVEVDHGKQVATYVRVPALGDVPYPVQMEPNLVVEFYSR